MGFHLRKRLLQETSSPHPPLHDRCETRSDYLLPPPQPLLPLPPRDHSQYSNRMMNASLIITACIIGGTLLVAIMFIIILKSYSSRNRSRRRNSLILFDTREEFLDEDHGPVIDHHIWFIQTVGLQQPVIDSITVFKYKNDEGLVDGTECSVCLSEFEEDESLRLLPKCSHAFHLPCIDTWLRSHKNCPLCRAPVVSDVAGSQVLANEPNLRFSGSRGETQVENLENYDGVERTQVAEVGTSEEVGVGDGSFSALEIEDGRRAEISKKSSSSGDRHSRVVSNLDDNQRAVEEELQPVRRSVSLDPSSALRIYHAVANIVADQGSSKTQLANQKSSGKKMVAAKPDSGTSSICKLIKSSSLGRSLQKGPISMKRSLSSSRRFLSSRHCRSASSVLPL